MRLAGLMAAAALLVAACGSQQTVPVAADLAAVVEDAQPGDTLRLEPGDHVGPIVIDQPMTIIGGPGVVVRSRSDAPAITIMDTNDVTLRALSVEGGASAIEVHSAEGVRIDGVEVIGAEWHGIFAHDAEITVTDCVVGGLRETLSQGIEIINSDTRPASRVSGCTIRGPVFEGIVAHVSHVLFLDNVVTDSERRGIVVTEMSAGRVEGNEVSDAEGAAYLCGDRSRCFLVRNTASAVGASDAGVTSADGHGVVVHWDSIAWIQLLSTRHLAGERVKLMLDGVINPDGPAP